jgi:hypothetical protein
MEGRKEREERKRLTDEVRSTHRNERDVGASVGWSLEFEFIIHHELLFCSH